MTPSDTEPDPIREQYDEYTTDSLVIAVITDPQNDRAWIESTRSCDVQP